MNDLTDTYPDVITVRFAVGSSLLHLKNWCHFSENWWNVRVFFCI